MLINELSLHKITLLNPRLFQFTQKICGFMVWIHNVNYFAMKKWVWIDATKRTELFNTIIMEVKSGTSPILLESFCNRFSFSSLDGFFWGACLHIEDKTNSIDC